MVYSSIFRQMVVLDVGMGLNLSNAEPTVCLNSLLGDDQVITREEYLAWTFNSLERLLDSAILSSSNHELDKVMDLYHEYWLHTGQKVRIQDADSNYEDGEVLSIDKDGFLMVKVGDGSVKTVHPDGSSFDMMQGHIVPKEKR